ncbi:MAG: electron transfer flavoprotein beta subunit/FixA family protein [Actinomycetaceae bacterium]|nr:electron transfer flavoprotein beta subunit/FixA family protein [Actinomycetaceae bacterium]
MAVVVAYKYAANPQDATVREDGHIDWSRAKKAVSEYDPVAIQVGRDLADELGDELVGISVGPVDIAASSAKKNAMSKGFDRGLILADDATAKWNATTVAYALAEVLRKIENVELLLTGDASVDEGARLMPALVAAHMGWPCFEEVSKVEKQGKKYILTQMLPGGVTRTIEVEGPLAVGVTSDAVTPKVASMKEILAAAKKPVEVITLADVSVPTGSEPRVTDYLVPEKASRKGTMLEGTPESIAQQLVDALKSDGVL